jgi:hypothetical protein
LFNDNILSLSSGTTYCIVLCDKAEIIIFELESGHIWYIIFGFLQISRPMSGERSHGGWITGSWISWTKSSYLVKLLVPGHQCQGGIGQKIIVDQGRLMENGWILRHSIEGGLLLWSIRGVGVTEAYSYEEIVK